MNSTAGESLHIAKEMTHTWKENCVNLTNKRAKMQRILQIFPRMFPTIFPLPINDLYLKMHATCHQKTTVTDKQHR